MMNDSFGTIFNAVDIAVLAYMVFGLVMGLKRGLSGELARLIGAVATLAVSLRYFSSMADFLIRNTRLAHHDALARPLAFFIIALCVGLFFLLLRILLQLILKITFNPKIDRFAGLLAGGTRALVVAALIIIACGLCPSAFMRRIFREQSAVGRLLFTHAPALIDRAQNFFHVSPESEHVE